MLRFLGSCLINSIYSAWALACKIILLVPTLLTGRPIVISQLGGILLIVSGVYAVTKIPSYILIGAYIFACLYYGIYRAYMITCMFETDFDTEYDMERTALWNAISEELSNEEFENAEKESFEEKAEPVKIEETKNIFEGMTKEDAKNLYHELLKSSHPDNGGDDKGAQFYNVQFAEYLKTAK